MVDMFMFSINPVYDYTNGNQYGTTGDASDRMDLYREAEKLGVGITVMKPFAAGLLLDSRQSPLGIELTRGQCLRYALDKPGVLACLPGVGSLKEVKELLKYYDMTEDETDYSSLGSAVPDSKIGRCVYCNHCSPCPAGIDVGLVNKYYDLARIGDEMAAGHYRELSINADACVQCGHCESRCPFHVEQMARMKEISGYFGK
jgi:predicted aldo/keto reductase-like oxidoreductase